MNDSITGVTSCPDNVRPGAANGALNRFAGRETQPVSGWMGVASIQPGSAVGYLFVVCIAYQIAARTFPRSCFTGSTATIVPSCGRRLPIGRAQ
jgi:hypothetical protein